MPTMTYILLSIKPHYTKKIVNGNKIAELRTKIGNKFEPGANILIYSSSPDSAIIACAKIRAVERYLVPEGVHIATRDAAVESAFYYEYFAEREYAYFIYLENVVTLDEPFKLKDMRAFGLSAPQSFCYVDDLIASRILN